MNVAENCTGKFEKEEAANFFDRLKMHFISFLVYPRVFTKTPNFHLRIGEVPPVMEIEMARDSLRWLEIAGDG